MKKLTFENMVKGWFIGNFKPTALQTNACEVAYKKYKSGDFDCKHYHKIATEVTFIVSGRVLMNDVEYKKDDIIVIEPGEFTDFMVLDDTETIVVKIPGANDDKYLI